ncbi:kazal-type serine protease inhibitor domain protein, partial [Ichthyophthirius multifiliis]
IFKKQIMQKKRFILTTFVFLLYIVPFMKCDYQELNKWIPCTPNERKLKFCTMIYFPVCGKLSQTETKTYGNRCSACTDPLVSEVILGQCKNDQQKRVQSQCLEQEKLTQTCPQNEAPVCAIFEDFESRNFKNRCQACQQKGILQIEDGECMVMKEKDEQSFNHYCDQREKENIICSLDYEPVCGIKNIELYKQQQRTQFTNKCFACSQGNFDFLLEGECQKYPQTVYLCQPGGYNFIKNCSQEKEDVVCALNLNGQMVDFKNMCSACKDYEIVWGKQGDCNK